MENVPKKRHKKRKNNRGLIFITAGFLIACVGICLWVNRPSERITVPEVESSRGSLTERETDEISEIVIRVKGREPWNATRDENGLLRLNDMPDGVIDGSLGKNLTDAMSNIVYEDIFTENEAEYKNRLAEFGLDDPQVSATVRYTDGQTITIHIGDSVGLEDLAYHYMIAEGDPRLYAVATSFYDDLQTEKELLREVIQPEIQTARIDRVTVYENGNEPVFELRLKGAVTDTDAAENWFLTAPFAYPGDYDTIRNYLRNVGQIHLGLDVGVATDDNKALYGIRENGRVIEVHMAAGSTGTVDETGAYIVTDHEDETLSLCIGDARNEMTDYVMYDGHIYTMNHFMVTALTESDPMEMVARYVAPYSTEVLSSLTVEKQGQTDHYELTGENISGTTEDGGDEETQIIYTVTKNGKEINAEAFLAAYQRLMVVTVSGKLPDGSAKKETKLKMRFVSVTGREHILELSDFDALHDTVTLDGYTVFYLIHDALDSLP